MITYKMNCGTTKPHKEFGIDVLCDGNLIKSVYNITSNKDDMIVLANMCNELSLELCHFDDVVEDYLTDFCI